MLELFTKSILELADLILKNRGPRAKMRKSARAALRFHWILKWAEIYSLEFIDGLQVLIHEGRIAYRLMNSLEGLKSKVDELYEIIRNDSLGLNTGFWQVAGVFDGELQRELCALVGLKVTRLEMWQHLLDSAFNETFERYDQGDCKYLFVATDSFDGPGDVVSSKPRTLRELMDAGQLRIIQVDDMQEISRELDKAKEIVKRITLARDRLDEFLRTHYSFEDFL